MAHPLAPDLARFRAAGAPFGRAVVTEVWGSAPRGTGAMMVADAQVHFAGGVSGGCVETAVIGEIGEAIARGTPALVSYGVSDETAWTVGLACGGTIRVWVEPVVRPEVAAAIEGPGGAVVATVLAGAGVPGAQLVVTAEGERVALLAAPSPDAGAAAAAARELEQAAGAVTDAAVAAYRRTASRVEEIAAPDGTTLRVLLEVFPRRPVLLCFGGVHVAAALVQLAGPLGYRTIVADGREAFLSRERFPTADELILAWPDEAFARVGLDGDTCVCVLSHDPKFDEPALLAALRSPARYVGAIGSRKTQAARRERLRAAGLTEEQLARLHGPIGLDLGGREPLETALAILAEITAVRFGGSAAPLTAR